MLRWMAVRQDYLRMLGKDSRVARGDLQLLLQVPWMWASLVMDRLGSVFAFNSQTALEKLTLKKEASASGTRAISMFEDQLELASIEHGACAPEQRGRSVR